MSGKGGRKRRMRGWRIDGLSGRINGRNGFKVSKVIMNGWDGWEGVVVMITCEGVT